MSEFWKGVAKALRMDQIRTRAMFTSTRQAEVLNPALVDSQVQVDSPFYGRSRTTGQPVFHSLHGLYRDGVIQGPNAAVIGGYGMGKSSLVKTVYALRPLACGTRVGVFDRKRQGSGGSATGEYVRLAQAAAGSAQLIVFDRRPGRGTIINPLDPAIVTQGDEDSMVGQDELLLMIAETACGRRLIDTSTEAPGFALRQAHKAAVSRAREQGRVPVLRDVIDALYNPGLDSLPGPRDATGASTLAAAGIVTPATLTQWGLPVALNLEKFVDGELSGLLDGPTTEVDFTKQLIVFDTSALGEGSQALGLMITVAAAFINARWSQMQGAKLLIVEEAYNLDRLESVPAIFRALAKRGRASGTGIVTVIHHLSDLKPNSDMWALVREADVVHIFRQDKDDDATQVIDFYSLPDWLKDTITTMARGEQLVKIGNRPPQLISHMRSALEVWITDTDEPMLEAAEAAPALLND